MRNLIMISSTSHLSNMGDEFYSILKLVSGEEVFALVCVDESDDAVSYTHLTLPTTPYV